MSATRAPQRDAIVKQFRSITNATAADATRILKSTNYRLEAATDAFFSDPQAMANAAKASGSSGAGASKKAKEEDKKAEERLTELYARYKEPDEDIISVDGTLRLCEDLGLDPEDPLMLAIAYHLTAPSVATFTRRGYIDGWKAFSPPADTLEKQRRLLRELRDRFESNAGVMGNRGLPGWSASAAGRAANGAGGGGSGSSTPRGKEKEETGGMFERVYAFTYEFGRPEGQKSLPLESAIAFWSLLIPISPYFSSNEKSMAGGSERTFTTAQLEVWHRFLNEETGGRAISRDTWMQFLDFIRVIDPKFEHHDFDAAWPSLFDEFVEWAREKKSREDGEKL